MIMICIFGKRDGITSSFIIIELHIHGLKLLRCSMQWNCPYLIYTLHLRTQHTLHETKSACNSTASFNTNYN